MFSQASSVKGSVVRMLIMRDLRGYGRNQPKIKWPNGAKLAISLVVNFEEGAEFSVEQGDKHNERMSEVVSVVPDDRRDYGQEQIFSYGMRAGLWRFLDAFDRHRFRSTFFMCGRAVERVPEFAHEVVKRGHEPACHAWRWQTHADYVSPAAERADLEKSIVAIADATGQRPTGFFCRGSESPNTRELLSDLGFEYASNAFDDDLPYYHRFADGQDPLLILPYALDCNDMKYFHPNGFVTADEFIRYVRDGVGVLLAEGEYGCPKMLNIGLHLRISGRPSRFAGVLGILKFLSGLGDDVWIATRQEIGRCFRAQFPPSEKE